MGDKTKIEYVHHTFNPWWGCAQVSEGCRHCFAKTFAHRKGYDVFGFTAPRRFFGEKHWEEPYRWNRASAKKGIHRRVLCGSMCDIMEGRRVDLDDARRQLWQAIQDCKNLDWLLLTKRPENFTTMLPWCNGSDLRRPWSQCWLGITAENQKWAERRSSLLLATPAAHRFVSLEPLLAAVDVWPWLFTGRVKLDLVIVGPESGPGARPINWDWVRAIRGQCKEAGVPLFVKGKGIPADLQIQELPA